MKTIRLLLTLLVVGLTAYAQDGRLDRLRTFLQDRPAAAYAAVFLAASDKYSLDWRLLPAIALVETSGGRHARHRYNWFGWRSGRARFSSAEEAIDRIASCLGEGDHYRGRSTDQKLYRYNRSRHYAARVRHIMAQIGSQSYKICCESSGAD